MENEDLLPDIEVVFQMKVDDLRKELKKKRLSTAGKKSILQYRLVEFIEKQQQEKINEVVEEENEAENMETDENLNDDAESNQTFDIVEEADEKSTELSVQETLDDNVKLQLMKELSIDSSDFGSRTPLKSIPYSVGRRSSRLQKQGTTDECDEKHASSTYNDMNEDTSLTMENVGSGVTPSRQTARDRFAAIHSKQIDEMETLGERRDRILRRHEELTKNVPGVVKRLATPKSVRRRENIMRTDNTAWQPKDPSKMTFKFGGVDASQFSTLQSQQASPMFENDKNGKIRSVRKERRDVKQLTKGASRHRPRTVIPATVTDDNTFVSFMATPKGATPSRVPTRTTYTPYTGKKKAFVDTTTLTDREYQLALEEGLIPGKSAKKRTITELRQAEQKKRRDDIIALKRKMKL